MLSVSSVHYLDLLEAVTSRWLLNELRLAVLKLTTANLVIVVRRAKAKAFVLGAGAHAYVRTRRSRATAAATLSTAHGGSQSAPGTQVVSTRAPGTEQSSHSGRDCVPSTGR